MGRPRRESLRHQQAFEIYYALGHQRSLSEVGRRVHTSVQAVQGWSVAFDWQKRLQEREKIVAELTANLAVEDEVKSRALQLNICRAVQARFAQSLQGNQVGISTQDFVRAAQHELLLRGKATERSEIVVAGALDALIDRIAAVIDRDVPDLCPACKGELGVKSKLAQGLLEASKSPADA